MLKAIGALVAAIVIALGVIKALELIRKRVNPKGDKRDHELH